MTTTLTRPAPATLSSGERLALRFCGALLALGVSVVHVIDQGGIPGSKTPTYVGVGYWVLEVVGVLVAVALLFAPEPTRVFAWFAALGVAVGPALGFVLSRGPGLPDYTDDKGNWTEPLGLVSLAIEALLLVVALLGLLYDKEPTAPPD